MLQKHARGPKGLMKVNIVITSDVCLNLFTHTELMLHALNMPRRLLMIICRRKVSSSFSCYHSGGFLSCAC